MTDEEAIREVRFNMSTIGLSDKAAKRVVEARYMAIKALEKQIPNKLINTRQSVSGCCPNCKKYISDWLEYNKFMCCPYCGQAIDWSDEE